MPVQSKDDKQALESVDFFYRVLYHCSLKLPSLSCILNPSHCQKPQGINSLDVMVQRGKADVINLQ